jgi:hypothetical protein
VIFPEISLDLFLKKFKALRRPVRSPQPLLLLWIPERIKGIVMDELDCDFDLAAWRSVMCHDDPPPGTVICTVDPQFASSGTDETGLAAAVIYECEDKLHSTRLLEAVGIKRKGGTLADGILDFVEKHKPTVTYIEGIPGTEMLRDVMIYRADLRHLATGSLVIHKPDRSTGAKAKRIGLLNYIVNATPHKFFVQAGNYVSRLFEQLEKFDGSKDARANHGRNDDVADAASQLIVHLPY